MALLLPSRKMVNTYYHNFYLNFKVYSDADIVLSKDWVPPITIAPTNISTSEGERSPARKKASSVSFSLDSASDIDSTILALDSKEEQDKIENRKNKVTMFTCIFRKKVQN